MRRSDRYQFSGILLAKGQQQFWEGLKFQQSLRISSLLTLVVLDYSILLPFQ